MTRDTDLRTRFEAYCTTATLFEEALSTLLIAAHENGIDVSGAWEASHDRTTPEWDVVVTVLERERAADTRGEDDTGP